MFLQLQRCKQHLVGWMKVISHFSLSLLILSQCTWAVLITCKWIEFVSQLVLLDKTTGRVSLNAICSMLSSQFSFFILTRIMWFIFVVDVCSWASFYAVICLFLPVQEMCNDSGSLRLQRRLWQFDHLPLQVHHSEQWGEAPFAHKVKTTALYLA